MLTNGSGTSVVTIGVIGVVVAGAMGWIGREEIVGSSDGAGERGGNRDIKGFENCNPESCR